MAEAISYYYPKVVELHNYPSTNAIKSKISNWKTLNNKVLTKLGLNLRDDECQKLASATPMMIETLLYELKKLCADSYGGTAQESKETYTNYHHTSAENYSHNPQANTSPGTKNPKRNLILDDFEGMEGMDGFEGGKGKKKDKEEVKGLQATKVEELREILKLLKEKINFVEKTIARKDAEIKELEEIIHLGL